MMPTSFETRYDRLTRQTVLEAPPLGDDTEFGFLPILIPAVAGLLGYGVQAYGQTKAAKSAEAAAKAQAEAAKRIAEMQAQQRGETMRSLTPILGIAVVGGLLVTVLIIKKKRG